MVRLDLGRGVVIHCTRCDIERCPVGGVFRQLPLCLHYRREWPSGIAVSHWLSGSCPS
jgi:hypothetical protein